MRVKKRFDKSFTLFLILFVLSSIMLLSNESFKATKEGALTFFTVIQKGLDSSINFTRSTLNSVGELRDLKHKYDLQKKELEEYRGIEREFLELKRENIEYSRLLRFSESLSHESIPCEIVGKDPSNLSSVMSINKGTRHGIKRNMPVVAEQDGLIGVVGKVINVGSHSSLILPLLDNRSFIAGRLTETRYEGLAKGYNTDENLLQLDYIKKIALSDIEIGDLVETSGMNSLYPKGYFIGRVISIKKVDYETSLQVKLQPIIDFSRLEYVSVLVSSGDINE